MNVGLTAAGKWARLTGLRVDPRRRIAGWVKPTGPSAPTRWVGRTHLNGTGSSASAGKPDLGAVLARRGQKSCVPAIRGQRRQPGDGQSGRELSEEDRLTRGRSATLKLRSST